MPSNEQTFGDPAVTPFVRFVQSRALYPPNSVYQDTQTVLDRLSVTKELSPSDLEPIFVELVKRGDCGGYYGVLPGSTWFALLNSFLSYRERPDGDTSRWLDLCVSALKMMVQRPHQSAWLSLRHFLTANIDELSGWSASWRRTNAESMKIFRGEDDNCYRSDDAGSLILVLGAKPLEETRMDFITDQVVHSYGFCYQFLALFALFSIADDFTNNAANYAPAMKAILSEAPQRTVGHMWHFMYFDRTRTFRWRPNSNMCDPSWLASDLLAGMTDTLVVDYFRRRMDTRKADENWVNDPCRYQLEYVIDSSIQIGRQEEVYLEFEGTTFRWINGTNEREAVVVVPVRDGSRADEGEEKLNRLLSALVWEHKVPIRKVWGSATRRKPFPSVYGPRMSGGIVVEADRQRIARSPAQNDQQWLALALFREALSSTSKFYSFLSYYKVLDLVFRDKDEKKLWLNEVAPNQTWEKDRLRQILRATPDLEEYFREERLNAIKHVWKTTLNPDDPQDERKIANDLHVIKDFARLAIEKFLR